MSENDSTSHLRWACRRGMLELDMLFLPFLENCYSSLSPELQKDFRDLLEANDVDLFAWMMQQRPVEETQFIEIIESIRNYAQNKGPHR